ncbi:hypothetical protein CANARDRAFT_29519 [[Candida] arabinofermentans NRRL YB-2248]|uniref:Uncharacterized protein n=1 Tax=[Candida] arabinofermentans NRRL YB-2248 TaxID=983967 RepID=A0A1E4SX36_9ASCO|nr:hypothetical protein CANARDRAFT_29519 [[Candida] arabinofermentans NRRL YB-2248]
MSQMNTELTQNISFISKSQSLLEFISETRNLPSYSSGISRLDKWLSGNKGFRQGGIYDLSCLPGSLGKWELIFTLMSNYHVNERSSGRKTLVISTYNKIPWFKLRSMEAYSTEFDQNIALLKIETLTQLIHLLQTVDFSVYGLVIIDEFHGLYEQSLINLRLSLQKKRPPTEDDIYNITNSGSSSRVMLKRDINGVPIVNPIKRMGLIMQNVMVQMSTICKDKNCTILTTGKMSTLSQRFYRKKSIGINKKKSSDSGDEGDSDEESDDGYGYKKDSFGRYITQQILVPILSLQGPWANYFTNRIILYRDWVTETESEDFGGDPSYKSGIQMNLGLNDHIQLIENKRLSSQPQFLLVGLLPTGENEFHSGWFKLHENRTKILDVNPLVEHDDEGTEEVLSKEPDILDGLKDITDGIVLPAENKENEFQPPFVPNKKQKLADQENKENTLVFDDLTGASQSTQFSIEGSDKLNNTKLSQIIPTQSILLGDDLLTEIPESQC